MYVNVFYFKNINSIGGIETFFWQLGKKYGKNFDITIFYRVGDVNQIRRLSQYVRVKKFRDGQKIRCKRVFLCFNLDIIDSIEADEYFFRTPRDYRKGVEVKKEQITDILEEYDVVAIFEDCEPIVQMYREMGLTVLQPNKGI